MSNRRTFIKEGLLVSGILMVPGTIVKAFETIGSPSKNEKVNKPIVISTWRHGLPANEAAWQILINNGRSLDAVEAGVKIPEADTKVMSVGYGGLPDRDGKVTLDACIMDEQGNCGSVAFLEHIMHPISVARMVMEKTPHIMIVVDGALKFALANGFQKMNLLTEEAKKALKDWLKNSKYSPDLSYHDTIGLLAIDNNGNLSGACTTSGLAWKYHCRVGDSPIIGAWLFVDNEVGAASATCKGEAVIKIAGTHLIVELIRNGKTPGEACKIAVERIVQKQKDYRDFQVGFIALNKQGEYGAYSLQSCFEYALYRNNKNELFKSESYIV